MILFDRFLLITDLHRKLFTVRHSIIAKGKGKNTSFRILSSKLRAFSGYFLYTPGDADSERKALAKAIRWMERAMENQAGYIKYLTDSDIK